jgi:hypothetical protein
MPFETWDAEGFSVTTPDGTTDLVHDGNFWRFPDDTEANLTAVQDRLRKLAELEASDYDLMAPLTPEMGTVEVVLEADEDGTPPVLRFAFHAPLEEGGRAMVQVSGRNNVMGVAVEDVEAILNDLDALRPEPPEEVTFEDE